jgi:hypothetical protein
MARALLLLFLLFSFACSGGEGEADADMTAPDAGADAGVRDSGLFPTPCGTATCTSDQYCQVDPSGACVPNMTGSCAATEEVCQQGGDGGCTTPKTRECRPLPAPCAATAQCACMIQQNLCPNQIQAMCRRPNQEGVTVECPFE